VVVSIFVNPTQFNQQSDFSRYPRRLARDAILCRKAGADLVVAPSARAMYPPGFSTWVEERNFSMPLCGRSRPGHFRGVCTVVAKLFNLVPPAVAIFGQKDAQQALVIRRMTRDLNIPTRIVIARTLREKDGLAMSSRNERLSPSARRRAVVIARSLHAARKAFRDGIRNARRLKQIARRRLLATPGLRLDYLELVDLASLRPVSSVRAGDMLVVAGWLGGVRLIDNVILR